MSIACTYLSAAAERADLVGVLPEERARECLALGVHRRVVLQRHIQRLRHDTPDRILLAKKHACVDACTKCSDPAAWGCQEMRFAWAYVHDP